MTTWGANTTLPDLADWLRTGHDTVILTHEKPDGDAIGSTLAIARTLARLGPPGSRRVRAWYWSPWPAWTKEFVGPTPADFFDRVGPTQGADPDRVVVVDTGSWVQVASAEAWLRPRAASTAIIDHHRQGNAELASRRCVDWSWSAACQPVAELCRILLGLNSCANLPREIADPLFLGVATDTGWFRHGNTTPQVLHLAADLVHAGADQSLLYQMTEQQDTPNRWKLAARALASLEMHADGRIAVMSLTQADFSASGATASDTGGLIDLPATIATARVCILLTEAKDGPPGHSGPLTKISLRSKNGPGMIDVNAVANKFGGGGHVGAAGAKIPTPLPEAKARVLTALAEAIAKGGRP